MLQTGEALPLVESFYTVQGEGFHTGKAAFFIRLGGCDVGCSWCDTKFSWDAGLHPLVEISEILNLAKESTARSVVVTGGEPLMFSLDKFCRLLKKNEFKTFLETSGACDLSGEWDWICLSPKQFSPPRESIYGLAGELKVIIQTEADIAWAEENAKMVAGDCKLFLQPEWSRYEQIIPVIVDYVKAHPKWMISLQAHKFMHIP